MSKTVHKPSGADIFIGIVVSLLAAFTFSPFVGLVVLLVGNIVGLSTGGITVSIVVGSLLFSVLAFTSLWRHSVTTRERPETADSNDSTESTESSETTEE